MIRKSRKPKLTRFLLPMCLVSFLLWCAGTNAGLKEMNKHLCSAYSNDGAVVVDFISFHHWICQSLVIHTISFALPRLFNSHRHRAWIFFRTLHFRVCVFFFFCVSLTRFYDSLVGFLLIYFVSYICTMPQSNTHKHHYTFGRVEAATEVAVTPNKLCVAIFLGERARSSHCFAYKKFEVDDVFCRFSFRS